MNQHLFPKISIVTPSFNQGKYIEETIVSVIDQKYPNYEHIIIDGGSTDQTLEVIDKYRSKIKHFISEPDRGQSHALNKGFSLADGDIFCWLNSDDCFTENSLYTVALSFMQHDVEMVAGICEVVENGQIVHRHMTSCPNGKIPLNDLLDLENAWNAGQFFYQPEVFFKKELWLKAGGYADERYYYSMDYELWCRFALEGARLKVIGAPLVRFRSHSEQKTSITSNFKSELINAREEFIRSNQLEYVISYRPAVDWTKYLRIAMVNDHGFQYGAGIAHQRIAGAFDIAGHLVATFDLLSSRHSDSNYSDVVNTINKFNPDIVIFGNIHGVEKQSVSLVETLSVQYPTYWISHDFWILTGRCGYPSGCNKLLNGCDSSCPTKSEYPIIPENNIRTSWENKVAYLNRSTSLTIWANSSWTSDNYKTILKNYGSQIPIQKVVLGVPKENFQYKDTLLAKKEMNIPESTFAIAFSASSFDDERKGGVILRDAIEKLRYIDLTLILIGRFDKNIKFGSAQVICLGYTDDKSKLSLALQAADIYVGPSLEETFGQVFIEAACCGTPSIGFNYSGVQDAIVDGITGIKVNKVGVIPLKEAIEYLYSDSDRLRHLSFTSAVYARAFFSLEACYHSLFTALKENGTIDKHGLPHKISFSIESNLIKKSSLGWSDFTFYEKINYMLRRKINYFIGLFPSSFTEKVRESIPLPFNEYLCDGFLGGDFNVVRKWQP